MNTEKIEKLKKSLSNSKIPADLKPKIEAEIKRLESLDAIATEKAKEEKEEAKEESREEAKPVAKTRKPRAKRTSTRKPSETSKPKRTAMSLAKEIRKEGEIWNDARARASKMMKEGSKEVSKTVESELDKLTKLVKSKKELRSQVGRTNLLIDAKRKAKPMGRRVSKDGNVYYENRANRTDRGTYGKYHLATGGYLTDPTFGNFQNQVFAGGGGVTSNTEVILTENKPNGAKWQGVVKPFMLKSIEENQYAGGFKRYEIDIYDEVKREPTKEEIKKANEFFDKIGGRYAKGGGIRRKNGQTYDFGRVWTKDHNEFDKGADHEVNYRRKRFELGGVMVTDLAGHTGGGDAGLNAGMPLSGVSGTHYTGLVGETGAMSSGEMFMNGGGLPSGAEQSYMIVDSFGNPAQHFAKGGGVTFKNGREYSTGRNWTNDHRHLNKGEDHEVKYTRKRFANGGGVGDFDVKVLVGRRVVYETKVNTLKKAQQIASRILSWEDDGFEYTIMGYDSSNNKIFENKNLYSDELPDRLKDKFATLKLQIIVLDMKSTKLDAGSFTTYKSLLNIVDDFEEANYTVTINGKTFYDDDYELGGGVTFKNGREYPTGRNWTNDHRHLNKGEEHEVNYTRKRSFAGGGGIGETPRIYVADLEAYNNGRLVGEWLDLSDYNDADELMDAIQDVLKKSGGEEYAIHDYENFPSSMYSEYMGKRDFEELYEMMDLADKNDLPLEVVQDVVSQFDASAVDEFYGKFDSADDFAYQLVEDIGIESFTDFQRYLTVSETDRRLLSQEMADSYVDDIRDEDGGNRLIEEARMDVSEYEEADNQTQEEMLDKAREIVYDEYYDNYFEGLSDPYYFLVEEQGIYDAESFANASFVQVDYEDLGDALEDDYTYIFYNSDLYVFNIR